MKNSKKINLNLRYSILSKIVIIGIGLILPRITMVNYGSETNGLLNSANQLVAYLTLFEAGIQAVAIKSLYSPVATDQKDDINQILSAVHIQYRKSGTGYLLGLIVISAIYAVFIRSGSITFLNAFLIVFFSGVGKVILFYFQGKYQILLLAEGKKYVLVNLQTLISVLNGIIKVILLYMQVNVVLVVFSSFAVSLLQTVYIMVYIRKYYGWIDLSVPPNNDALDQKNSALVHQISTLVFQNTDVLILTVFCDLKVVSVYSLYKVVMTNITSMLYMIYDSFDFSMGQLFHTSRDRFIKSVDVADTYYGALTYAIYATTLILLRPFIMLYTRGVEDISYVDTLLPVLFVLVEILTVSRKPMLCTIGYAGHFEQTVSRTILETILNLLVSLILVGKIGIYGVLIGTIVAMTYRTADILIYTNKHVLNRSSFKTLVRHGANMCLYIVAVWFAVSYPIHIRSYGDFICKGFIIAPICIAVYVVIQSVINPKQFHLLIHAQKKRKGDKHHE